MIIIIDNIGEHPAQLEIEYPDERSERRTIPTGASYTLPEFPTSEEPPVDPMTDRIRALEAAKTALRFSERFGTSAPVDPIDLISVARWVHTGEDPWHCNEVVVGEDLPSPDITVSPEAHEIINVNPDDYVHQSDVEHRVVAAIVQNLIQLRDQYTTAGWESGGGALALLEQDLDEWKAKLNA